MTWTLLVEGESLAAMREGLATAVQETAGCPRDSSVENAAAILTALWPEFAEEGTIYRVEAQGRDPDAKFQRAWVMCTQDDKPVDPLPP